MNDAPTGTVFSFGEDGYLLPPAEGLCTLCARDHEPNDPHDAQSLQYKYWFFRQRGRWPNWADAIAHVPPESKDAWLKALRALGVDEDELQERA